MGTWINSIQEPVSIEFIRKYLNSVYANSDLQQRKCVRNSIPSQGHSKNQKHSVAFVLHQLKDYSTKGITRSTSWSTSNKLPHQTNRAQDRKKGGGFRLPE